jgi:multiple sugar transport system substrate-binding protein
MDCQRVVADEGVVFPAITEAWEIKQRNYADEGIDVTPFTDQVEQGTTFPFPISEHPADITAELTRTMESVLGGASPDAFTAMNRRINGLFED